METILSRRPNLSSPVRAARNQIVTKGQKVSVRITNVEVARSIRHVFRPANDFDTVSTYLFAKPIGILDIDVGSPVLVCGYGPVFALAIQCDGYPAALNNSEVRTYTPGTKGLEPKLLAVEPLAPLNIRDLKNGHAANHGSIVPKSFRILGCQSYLITPMRSMWLAEVRAPESAYG